MQAVLVMFRADGERRSFSVTRDMTVIGRREDCDLRIPVGEVSRKHCRLVRDDDSLRVEDLGSSNGTYVNGQRVQEATLTPGDSVQVGPVVFVLQVDGQTADEELTPITVEELTQEGDVEGIEGLSAEVQDEGDDLTTLETLDENEIGDEQMMITDDSDTTGGVHDSGLGVHTDQAQSRHA
jgi:pSer/pThr/pTyr-binding forkhead associated (FHA) protein